MTLQERPEKPLILVGKVYTVKDFPRVSFKIPESIKTISNLLNEMKGNIGFSEEVASRGDELRKITDY